MQIERKKLSSCLIPGAAYHLWNGCIAVALSCNTLLYDGKIYHTYQLGDCENCNGFEKIDITQFSQSPYCLISDLTRKFPAHAMGTESFIKHNGKPYAIVNYSFVELNKIKFDLIAPVTLEKDNVTLGIEDDVDWYEENYPVYPQIGIKTYQGYEVKAVDLTDPVHCVLCDVEGVETWLPAKMK